MASTASLCASRLAAIEARIAVLEAAALGIETGAIFSYTLDTGQTRQTVTKATLGQLEKAIDSLYNQHATTNARCNGAGITRVLPAF